MLCNKVREYRIKAGLTQSQLAESSGVSQAAIAQYEAGSRNPRIDIGLRLATALNVLPAALCDYSTDAPIQLNEFVDRDAIERVAAIGEFYLKNKVAVLRIMEAGLLLGEADPLLTAAGLIEDLASRSRIGRHGLLR